MCSRSGLARLVHALALLGTLAGIAHILSVLLVPRYAVFDAASRFLSAGADARAELVTPDGNGVSPILDADDLTEIAVCGYDLEDGPLRVSARAGTTPLAISLHIRGGGVVYAVTDRAAQRVAIDAETLGEVALGRYPGFRRMQAGRDLGAQSLGDLAPQRDAATALHGVRHPADAPP